MLLLSIRVLLQVRVAGLPGEHAEEGLNDLLSEGYSHLHPQSLEQCEEETQHLIRHI